MNSDWKPTIDSIRNELDDAKAKNTEFKRLLKTRNSEIEQQRKRIQELEAWIESEGRHFDTCTFSILKRVCDGCRCERREKK